MTRKLIATVLAASMALTAVGTAPARAADSGEIGRFLLGAGTLFVIGNALNNSNNKRRHTTNRNHGTYYSTTPPMKHDPGPPRHRTRTHKVVPGACLQNNRYQQGPRRFFSKRCLSQYNVRRLPGGCLTSVYSKHGYRSVYAARCLKQNGWVVG